MRATIHIYPDGDLAERWVPELAGARLEGEGPDETAVLAALMRQCPPRLGSLAWLRVRRHVDHILAEACDRARIEGGEASITGNAAGFTATAWGVS